MEIIRVRNINKFIQVGRRMSGPKILVADIETFPILAHVWGLFKQSISLEQIAIDWSIMSFAAKWLQNPELFYLDNRRAPGGPRDDSAILSTLNKILSEADMVVAHNGSRFDLPKIRARMALLGYPPLPPVKVIDTLNLNRAAFGFTSQKLAYVSSKFAVVPKNDHAKYPGWKLWLGCLANERAAWEECEAYNIPDVTSLEESYLELRGWYQGGPNFGPYFDNQDGEHLCPNCGSKHVLRRGTRKTQVGIYARYQCLDCGGWSRGRTMVADRSDRSHILMN